MRVVRLTIFDDGNKSFEHYHDMFGDALELIEVIPQNHKMFCSQCGRLVTKYADERKKICNMCVNKIPEREI